MPSLPVGTYSVTAKANGMASTEAKGIVLDVGTTVKQDFALSVASSSQVVEIQAAAGLVDTSTSSVTSTVNERAVQEIPLNGRHFVDLAQLTTGTVQGPAVGNLTVPLRGQGTFSFNSAGGREDTVNFMVNGINMNDPNNQQVTFQPTINTVDEFIIDNSTFSAEYGRNSGSIVNVATRPGVNVLHGEAYEFLRNDDLDARNYTNPTFTNGGVPSRSWRCHLFAQHLCDTDPPPQMIHAALPPPFTIKNGFPRSSIWPKGDANHGKVSDWGEVVTR